MPIAIRRATLEDAPRLTDLARRAKAHWGYPAAWLAAWQPALTIAPAYLGTHCVLVAEGDGQPVGMCAIEDRGQWWALEHLWVDPGSIGQGVGRSLVERAMAVARASHLGRVMAEADPNAAGFYRKLGARQAGVVPAPMPGAPDRVLPVFEFELVGAEPAP
jgi:N-acetylglutamate synthase-like GNAT family acetyltransferase